MYLTSQFYYSQGVCCSRSLRTCTRDLWQPQSKGVQKHFNIRSVT